MYRGRQVHGTAERILLVIFRLVVGRGPSGQPGRYRRTTERSGARPVVGEVWVGRRSKLGVGEGHRRRQFGLGFEWLLVEEEWVVGQALAAEDTLATGQTSQQ